MAGQPQSIEPGTDRRTAHGERLRADEWDGRMRSYIPGPKLRVAPNLKLHTEEAESIHPVTFEVIRNALWIVNQEQADTIRKVSSSPVTTFAFDFNTSIQDEVGDGVVFAPYLQYFPGMADLVVRWTIENLGDFPGIHDGDLFIQNDPLIGVSHQMDFQAFAPVFVGDELFCWIFNSIHVRDIGGVAPGSFCVDARDIYSEATPIPPLKIVERGRIRPDIEAALMRHSRLPGLLALDLRSQMAGIHASRVRILDLVRRYGAATVKAAMRKIVRDTRRAVGERLSRLPDGTWTDVSYLGGMYTGDRGAYRVLLGMKKQGDHLTFFNDGTDPARIYGVIAEDGAADASATEKRRKDIRAERIGRASPPPLALLPQPSPNGTPLTHLHDVAEELELVAIGPERYIVCKDCGHFICAGNGNYKLGAARIDGSLMEIDSELFPDPATEFDVPIVYREFLCPNCGVLLENELVHADEPPVRDVHLD